LDVAEAILDVVDLRSFSSIWYWIVLAVVWSTASHWVLGVPFDIILRARRQGAQAMADLEDIVRVNVSRMLYISRESGPWILGFLAFFFTFLLLLAVWYRIEMAQAIALLAVPLTLIGFLTLSTAHRIETAQPQGDDLIRVLVRHRLWTQVIGMISVFVTATYGMYHNLALPPGF
jgi:hypothetical protein